MLGWLKGLLAGRDADGWKPSERLIYVYFDGSKMVRADPLPIQRRLLDFPDLSLEIDVKLASGSSPEASKAMLRLIQASRSAFQVTPYEKGGLADAECLSLLAHFGSWLADLKKKANWTQTLPPVSGLGQGASPTADGSASSSCETDPSTEAPCPLPSA